MRPLERDMKEEWSEFGFHDITCDVPADWDPTHIEGMYEKGYVRLDDVRAPRLEIRWERPFRRVSLSGTIDKHIKLVAKEARRAGRELRVQRDVRLAPSSFDEWEAFSYKNHVEALGLATHCRGCRRVLILRVFAGEGGGALRQTAARIFQSLRDHPKQGKSLWNLYGFRFEVPEGFRLVASELKTGRLFFDFAHRGTQLTIGRAALAGMVLKERSLSEWLEKAQPKFFRSFVVEKRREEYRGHSSLVFTGRYKLRLRLTRFMVRPWFLHCRVWHCERSDKIFVFRVIGRRQEQNELEKCADLVYCH